MNSHKSFAGFLRQRKEQARRAAQEAARKRNSLKGLESVFIKYGVARAYVFGSVTRNSCRSDSDIDLYVEGVALESYWDLWKETEEYTRKIGGEPHYQLPPHAQSKLVRAITGRVLDVAVDIRKDSPTFGLHVTAELSEENKHQLFIPAGFAHDGFLVLSQEAVFSYKVDAPYAPDHERGIYYADPVLEIDWSLPPSDMRLSEKDRKLPLMVTGDG